MDDNKNKVVMTHDEKLAIKYRFLRNKIFEHYKRGLKYVRIAKIVVAIIFIIFTVIAVTVGNYTGNRMNWLVDWVVLIFLDVFVFMIIDYVRYLIDDKVIPYLMDDDKMEFGEYDIFLEDITPTEEDE